MCCTKYDQLHEALQALHGGDGRPDYLVGLARAGTAALVHTEAVNDFTPSAPLLTHSHGTGHPGPPSQGTAQAQRTALAFLWQWTQPGVSSSSNSASSSSGASASSLCLVGGMISRAEQLDDILTATCEGVNWAGDSWNANQSRCRGSKAGATELDMVCVAARAPET